MSIVSNNIKYLRRMNGLTQEQFARKIGIKRSLLGAYEEARANPNLENLMNIAKIFGTTVDHLLKNDIRKLRESKGVPIPQGSHQLAIKEEHEPPKQLSSIIDKYYRSANDIKSVPQRVAFQPVKSAAPSLVPSKHSQTYTISETISPLPDRYRLKESIALVSQKDVAEYLSSYAYPEYLKQLPDINLPMLTPGKYRAFEAGSDFMYQGAILIGQFVNNWYDIRDGQNYILVIHKQGVLYRRVYNQVKIRGTLLVSSDQPRFPSFEVSIKEILEIWEAKSFICNQMPEPSSSVPLEKVSELVKALQQEVERLKKE